MIGNQRSCDTEAAWHGDVGTNTGASRFLRFGILLHAVHAHLLVSKFADAFLLPKLIAVRVRPVLATHGMAVALNLVAFGVIRIPNITNRTKTNAVVASSVRKVVALRLMATEHFGASTGRVFRRSRIGAEDDQQDEDERQQD